MRLMEVDEAANHIKDLVDPDANIIWGSAFNNELEGKIRVSVVATGIDVEEATQATPLQAKVFTFPGARAGEAAKAEAAAPGPAAAPEPISLTPPEPAAEPDFAGEERVTFIDEPTEAPSELALDHPDDEEEGDELLLDTLDEPSAGEHGVEAEPEAPAGGRRTWLTRDSEAAEPEQEAKPEREGGTLFERMSNIARGAAKAQVEDETPRLRPARDPLDIPRFLNRQNNQ
jgi:cell division protein FtsZ